MAAQTGEPVATYISLTTRATIPTEGVPIEIQKPMPDALLAVCGACGFEWDADHVVYMEGDSSVREGAGTPVYECPRCIARAAVDQMVIAANQRDEATAKMASLASVDHLQREVAHLRPQNELLMKEAKEMREALRTLSIRYRDVTANGGAEGIGVEMMECSLCRGTWLHGSKEEAHVRGCLADAP